MPDSIRPLSRPPPRVLLIHDGASVAAHVQYLREAGLDVHDIHADQAVSAALSFAPDIIILDYDCDGDILAQLKGDTRTAPIPVIGLKNLEKRQ